MNPKYIHQYLQASSDMYQTVAQTVVDRLEEARSDERGMTSTEVAILAFVLTGIAIALGAVLWTVVEGRAGQIDDIENPTFDLSDG